MIFLFRPLGNMSDSETFDLAEPSSPVEQPVEQPVETISPRKSIRKIHQDLRCFVIGDQYDDTKACQNAISRALQALVKHSELSSSIKQARK